MIKVKSLHIYPIKGMQGISVDSALALERGFKHDRRYMLTDEKGVFLSQRSHPELVYFYPQVSDSQLLINYKGEVCAIDFETSMQGTFSTTLFDKPVDATEVSHEANKWFSEKLGQNVRLVKMMEKDIRHKELIKGPSHVEVSFADGYPYLILGTSSLDQLNGKLEDKLNFNRFRPNIVVETEQPHVEDSWEDIKIGEGSFLVVKPCARCPVVTVDQNVGTKSKEPLKTLATYRKMDNKVYFGANAISRKDSIVHVGDEVIIL